MLAQFKDIASVSFPDLVSDLFTISNAFDKRSLKPFSTPTDAIFSFSIQSSVEK